MLIRKITAQIIVNLNQAFSPFSDPYSEMKLMRVTGAKYIGQNESSVRNDHTNPQLILLIYSIMMFLRFLVAKTKVRP